MYLISHAQACLFISTFYNLYYFNRVHIKKRKQDKVRLIFSMSKPKAICNLQTKNI